MKKTPLRKMSKAKAKEMRKYYRLKADALHSYPICEWPEGCNTTATQIHHAKGRHGELLNNKNFWWLLCQFHHAWVHTYPNKARKIEGLLLI